MVTQVKWWSHLQGRERNDNVMTSPFFLEGSYLLEICKTKFFFTNHVTLRLTKHLKITRDVLATNASKVTFLEWCKMTIHTAK